MRLGILDFCPIRKGRPPAESLYESVELAREADALGYSRYWLAEHHELGLAHHSPETLMGLIAGSTERIRVGVAGILMGLHSPMRVAKVFKVLEAFFAGRLDLGVGAGSAEAPVLAAMRDGAPMVGDHRQDYVRRVTALLEFLRGESPLHFNPLGVAPPPVWVLASGSPETASLAASLGTCFGHSLIHPKSRDDAGLAARYVEEFRPRPDMPEPRWVVAVTGLCAETEAEARRLASLSPDDPKSGLEIVGSPAQCRERFQALCESYRTDEIIFKDFAPDPESRLRCHRLLAEALKLTNK
jgi:luciferase family oxidoreductase group 1